MEIDQSLIKPLDELEYPVFYDEHQKEYARVTAIHHIQINGHILHTSCIIDGVPMFNVWPLQIIESRRRICFDDYDISTDGLRFYSATNDFETLMVPRFEGDTLEDGKLNDYIVTCMNMYLDNLNAKIADYFKAIT